jgi:hypothetical protein
MGRTELPWLWRGRHVRPYAFAVSLVMAVLTYYILWVGDDAGTVFDGRSGASVVAGLAAGCSFGLLWFGFWWQSGSAMKAGLLVSASVMMARSWLIAQSAGWLEQSVWFSLCWVLASSGAYLLELTTGDRLGAGERETTVYRLLPPRHRGRRE